MYSLVLFKSGPVALPLTSSLLFSLGFLFMETLPARCLIHRCVGDKSLAEPLAHAGG